MWWNIFFSTHNINGKCIPRTFGTFQTTFSLNEIPLIGDNNSFWFFGGITLTDGFTLVQINNGQILSCNISMEQWNTRFSYGYRECKCCKYFEQGDAQNWKYSKIKNIKIVKIDWFPIELTCWSIGEMQ